VSDREARGAPGALESVGEWHRMRVKKSEIIGGGVVVVFIAVILSVVVYPAAKDGPRKICLSHLTNLSRSITAYLGDYNGEWPLADSWADALVPYVDTPAFFICPDANLSDEDMVRLRGGRRQGYPVGYALFAPLAGPGFRVVTDPSKTPTIFDSTDIRANATADIKTLAFRHYKKTGNVLFGDSHAASFSAVPEIPQPMLKVVPQSEKDKAAIFMPPPPVDEHGHDH
jgi:prepilin-type processing-associated H-X9-DG protein